MSLGQSRRVLGDSCELPLTNMASSNARSEGSGTARMDTGPCDRNGCPGICSKKTEFYPGTTCLEDLRM